MQYFERRDGELFIEGVSLEKIAEQYGTPSYVYSRSAIEAAYSDYARALGATPGKICYAIKANSNLAILQCLAKLGAGFDIVSGGELKRVLKAGGKAENIIFSGVGKTAEEMRFALEQGIGCFNVESEAELIELNRVAEEMGAVAPISLRVNPDVDARTHPYISTGLKENKFGVAIEQAEAIYARAAELNGLRIEGVDCHIGSQLTEIAPFIDALKRLLNLIDSMAERGIQIRHLDLGGGVGVRYKDETPPSIQEYLDLVRAEIGDRDLAIYMEPGRSIVANAGCLLTRVLYLKPTEHKNFAVVDAAMNDNIRPALYQAWQAVQSVSQRQSDTQAWDIVGPVCETGDWLAKDRQLALEQGDTLAMMSAGAYCMVMSSNYNSRGRAAEILVSGERHSCVRARESFDDLVQNEVLLGEGDL